MKKQLDLIKQFCYIELHVLKDRELRLRKEIQDCLIQKEFVNGIIEDLGNVIVSPPYKNEES
tara:strand:- start:1017 stop:1202 length:186 start_codon:yes stop_codon:yes gene_type:complete